MKILHLMIRLAEIDGGPPHGLLTLAKAQAELGDAIGILPCTSTGGKPVIEPGQYGNLTVYEPPTRTNIKLPDRALSIRIDQLTQEYDLIHVHNSWRYHLIAAKHAARRYQKPYIVSPEGNLGRIPRSGKKFLKQPYFLLFEKPVLENATAIHSFTRKEDTEIKDLKLSPRHFIVPQPVDSDILHLEPDDEEFHRLCPGIKEGDICLLYMGRIARIKNLPMLVKAFIVIADKIKNCHLVLAGPWQDMSIVSDLNKFIAEADLQKRFHLPGMVKGKAKAAAFKRADIFVQPSFHESFGISVAEALFMKLPCIVNEGVALSADIEKGQAGLVFPGTVETMAEQVMTVADQPDLRKKFSDGAQKIAANFLPDKVARQFREEYQQCIQDYNHAIR